MDFIKTQKINCPNEEQKNKFKNIQLLSKNKRSLFNKIYPKLIKYDAFKPADPLISRKFIKSNPIKYPSITPTLTLPYFNYESKIPKENFTFIANNNNYNSNANNININLNSNINKEIQINNYINMNKMLQRLIYCKKPPDKDELFTIDNIINLNVINNEKKKKKYKENKNETKLNISENINNIGIPPKDIINFESNFECGNLQLVYLDEINNYQLFLHNDTNTTGYSQWFFFRITNVKKNQKINLNIMNFQRKTTKYSNGLKIWYYSTKKNNEKNISWHHTTEKVNYYQNGLYRYINGKRQYYYTLSFDYTIEYDDDEIYFANCIPFTYSDIIKDLNEYTKKENDKYYYFERKKLCSTLIGNDVDYFNINNNIDLLNFEENNNKKKGIVLFARQHPGETVGSWVIKGAIELLMGESAEAKYLRDNFIIKVIPMVNVDGVICGNSRTSLAGCDLNRRWVNPNEYLHPEIYFLKELIYKFSKKNKVEYIIDFHGHFGAFNSFFYSNNSKENIELCRKFPFICGKISEIIQFKKSRFKMPKYKKGTGRINLYKELDIENIVTLETSYFGCIEGNYSNQYFNIEKLKEIGKDICKGIILSYYNNYAFEKPNIKIINDDIDFRRQIENKLNIINKEFEEYINGLKNKGILNNNDNENCIDSNNAIKDQNEEDNEENNENNSNEDENDDESDSESEPSRDNLEEEQIKVLLPFFKKKKNFKKTKKNFSTFKNYYIKKNQISIIKRNNNNNNNNILTPQTKISSFPKIETNQTIVSKNNNKILTINQILYNNLKKQNINLSNKFLYKNKLRKNSPLSITNTNKNSINLKIISREDKQTQTEEKFFNLHWSTFFGIYKILSYKYEDKNVDESFSIITLDRRFRNNKNKIPPSNLTSFNYNIKEYKNDSDQIYMNSRNKTNINKYFNSDYYDKNIYYTKYVKKDNHKISYSSEERIKEKNIKFKNKIKDKGNSIQKVIKSFISNITNLSKNDFLKKYLNNEDRMGSY